MEFLKNKPCYLCGGPANHKRYWGSEMQFICPACELLTEAGRHPKQPQNKDVLAYFERAKKNERT